MQTKSPLTGESLLIKISDFFNEASEREPRGIDSNFSYGRLRQTLEDLNGIAAANGGNRGFNRTGYKASVDYVVKRIHDFNSEYSTLSHQACPKAVCLLVLSNSLTNRLVTVPQVQAFPWNVYVSNEQYAVGPDHEKWGLSDRYFVPDETKIHEWTDGEEFERVLLQIIDAISVHKSVQLSSTDFKLHPTISVPAHKDLPKVLCVT